MPFYNCKTGLSVNSSYLWLREVAGGSRMRLQFIVIKRCEVRERDHRDGKYKADQNTGATPTTSFLVEMTL